MSGDREAEVEERLSVLTGGKKGVLKGDASQYKELLAAMKSDEQTGGAEKFVSRYLNLRLLFDQADVHFPIPQVPADLRRPRRRRSDAAQPGRFQRDARPRDGRVPRRSCR